ncbi:MAG: glycosyltransferase family 2 protein [Methanosphaera stadtmanae]|nr:glycosyltransferase family 2 protein [Methanosphaera stadtmanae]
MFMSDCKISVIIPVYNSADYLCECLDSLISQTFNDFEVICIDDGSTDKSKEILEEYSNKDIRFNVFSQENSGPAVARNNAIDKAIGEYILFLDSDDWLKSDTLEKLYSTACSNSSELVLFNAIEHYKDNITRERIYHIHADETTDFDEFSFDYNNNINLVMNGYHIVCTKLHKRSFINENNIRFKRYGQFEDIYFHIKSMICAKRISYNPEIFYHYRRTQEDSRQNTTISTDKSFVLFSIFDEVEELLEEYELSQKLHINFIRFKVNETYNIFNNIKKEYTDELYKITYDEFNKMNLNNKDILRLPLNHQIFYKSIIQSSDYLQYEKLLKKNKILTEFKGYARKLKNKIMQQ